MTTTSVPDGFDLDPEDADRWASLEGGVSHLTSMLFEESELEDLLEKVLQLTSRAITASAAASVTVIDDDGSYATAASSHAVARDIDELQYELEEGPCIDSLHTGEEHHLRDVEAGDAWPEFCQQAAKHGLRTVLSLPLIAGGEAVGALNIFADGPEGLDALDIAMARGIASPAAATLANARAYRQARRLAEQLDEAMRSRSVIEQAKGVLMATRHCDADEAFRELRALSQTTNHKLRDVAADLVARAVAGAQLPPPPAN